MVENINKHRKDKEYFLVQGEAFNRIKRAHAEMKKKTDAYQEELEAFQDSLQERMAKDKSKFWDLLCKESGFDSDLDLEFVEKFEETGVYFIGIRDEEGFEFNDLLKGMN